MSDNPSQLKARQYGGSRQVLIENAAHLEYLDKIDPALWAATSVPVRDLNVDPDLLKILDATNIGRLRSDDLISLRDWLFLRLAHRDGLGSHSDAVKACDFNEANDAGAAMKKGALHLLAEVGKAEGDTLTLADVRDFRGSYSKRLVNGDGVVTPAQITSDGAKDFAEKIIATIGGSAELSGETGVGKADIEKFRAEAKKYVDWEAQGKSDAAIHPMGDDTEAAYACVTGLKAKVEEFFDQCALLELEGSAKADLQLGADALKAIAQNGPDAVAEHLKKSPIAPPSPDGKLDFEGAINPLYKAAIETLRNLVIAKHPGLSAAEKSMPAMDRDDWKKIEGVFGAYAAWKAARPAGAFDALPADLLDAEKSAALDAELVSFIDKDLTGAGELSVLEDMEKLLLLQRWFLDVACSMVNFHSLYAPKERSILNAGTLVIDGRRLEFCQRVFDRAGHKKIATESLFFLVYAAISEKEGAPVAMEVVAPLTAGERGQLRVGKRGLFVDHKGKQWDAVIVDMVENPISLSEAIRAPFKKAAKTISEKIESLTSAKMKEQEDLATGKLNAGLDSVEAASKAPPAPAADAAKPAAPAADAKAPAAGGSGIKDLVLGGGIAFAALGSSIAFIVKALSEVNPLNAAITVVSVILAIVLLLTLMSWNKLKKRDLSLLFEANGWAVNARQKLSRRLGGRFTISPKLPKGTKLVLKEPAIEGEEPKSHKGLIIAIVVAILAIAGAIGYQHHVTKLAEEEAKKAEAAQVAKAAKAADEAKKADEAKPAEEKAPEAAPAAEAAAAPAEEAAPAAAEAPAAP